VKSNAAFFGETDDFLRGLIEIKDWWIETGKIVWNGSKLRPFAAGSPMTPVSG